MRKYQIPNTRITGKHNTRICNQIIIVDNKGTTKLELIHTHNTEILARPQPKLEWLPVLALDNDIDR